MKILVAIKRVIDPNIKVRILTDKSDIDLENTKMGTNPFCEIAIEEAIRLRESNLATEVVAVTIGPSKCQEQLRNAIALGVDRVIHIETDDMPQPLDTAKILKAVYDKEQPKLVILGKQSIDGDNNQTGQMLAALASLPQGTFASEVKIEADEVLVTREVDDGLQQLALKMPAIITTDLRLNQPRYATLPKMMKAKRAPIETLSLLELSIKLSPRLTRLQVCEPEQRKKGKIVANVSELVSELKNEEVLSCQF